MINETILFLPHTKCKNPKMEPYVGELGINVNWDPDLHVGAPLSKIFKKVIRFDIGEAYCNEGVNAANKKIVDLVKQHAPKYVFWPTMTYEITEETFQKIHKLGSFVVGWFFDDENRFYNYSKWWIPYMDFILTSDYFSVQRYNKLGADSFYMPVTCEPDDFKSLQVPTKFDVSFVGSKYVADREEWVKSFQSDGINIATFGKGWENGFVTHEEMVKIFSTSKINICFTKSSGERNQVKGKIFDITMCGGFLLCEYVEGIEQLFEIEKEIVCFKSHSEALEKIDYFLKNDIERKAIAKAGQLKTTQFLSQHKLLADVFEKIENKVGSGLKRNINTGLVGMSKQIRIAHANYHLRWAKALKKIGYGKKYWTDEYNLAKKYSLLFSVFNFRCKIIGRVISILRLVAIKIISRIKMKLKRAQHVNIRKRIASYSLSDFSKEKLKNKTLSFVNSMKIGSGFEYKYSKSCSKPNIYSSAYACIMQSFFGKIENLSSKQKEDWAEYFNSFQNENDGLFYDSSLDNTIYEKADWWGARHVLVHLINAYIVLGKRPKYQFLFLNKYYDINYLEEWLSEQNWNGAFSHANDFDNKLMNIVSAMQYQRDYWQDEKASKAVKFIQGYLLKKINPNTGMWGNYNISDKKELSRMVQFAYHLFTFFFYDGIDLKNKERIIDLTLKTQNKFGGFGFALNSSACEDIDSIYILINISKLTSYRKKEIESALKKAFIWVLVNQNEDGGYTFKLNESFVYGHEQMTSKINESAMFPTWFRSLALIYLSDYLEISEFSIIRSPGY